MPPDIDPTAAERYAIEIRAAVLRTVTAANEGRRGVSDRLEIGSGASYIVDGDEEDPYPDSEDSYSSDSVSGMEEVRVGGDLWENVRRNRTLAARKLEMTVHGKLTLECMSDTAMFGGGLTETHVGGEFLAAGMSDDLVIGVGVRATAAGDLWTTGVMGMEEKIGTAAADGTLVETYAVAMEREFGPGMHISQVALFKGALQLTTAAGFRQMMQVQLGYRNHTPGGGGGGGGSGQPPPAAGTAAGGGAIAGGLLLAGGGAAGSFNDATNLADLAQAARVAEDMSGLEDVRHLDSLSVVEDLRSVGRAAENGEDVTELPQMRRLQDLTEFPSPAGVAQTDELARGEDTGTLVVHAEIETDWLNNVGVADGDGRNVADGGGGNVLDGKAEGGGYLDTLTDLRQALEDEPAGTTRRAELEHEIAWVDELAENELDEVLVALNLGSEDNVSAEYARGRLLELRDDYRKAGDTDAVTDIQQHIDVLDGLLKGRLETAGDRLLLDLSKPAPLPPPPPESWVQTLAELRLMLAKEPAGSDRALELEGVIDLADIAARQKFEDALHSVIGLQPDANASVMGKYLSILDADYYRLLDAGEAEKARETLIRISAMNLGDPGYFRGQLVEMRDDLLAVGKFDKADEVNTHLDSLDSFLGQQFEEVMNSKLLGGDGGTPGARPPPLPPPAGADAPYSKFNFGTDVAPGGRLDDLDAASYGKLGDAPDEDIYAEVFVLTPAGKMLEYNKGAVVDDGGSAAIRTSGALQPVDDSAGALRGGDLDIGLPQVDVEDAAGLRSGLDSPDVLEGPGYARIEDTPAALESRPPAPIPDARARMPDPDLDDAADARHAAPEIGPDGAGWGTGGDVENEYATVRDGSSFRNRPVMPENQDYKPNIRNTLEVFAAPPPAGSANGRYTLELSEDTYDGVESGTIVLKVYDEAGDELRPGSYVITKAPDAPPPPERTTQQILEDLTGTTVSVDEWSAQNVKGWLEANPGADGRTVEDLRPVLDGIPDDYSLPADAFDTTHYATPRSLRGDPPPMNDDTFRQGLLDGPDHIYSKVLGDKTGQGIPWNWPGTVGGPVGSPNFAGKGTVGPWNDLTGADLTKWVNDAGQSLGDSSLFQATTAEEFMSHTKFDDFRKYQKGDERRTLEWLQGTLTDVVSGMDEGDSFARLDVAADAAEVENARVRQANADLQWLRDSAVGHIGGRSSQTDPWKPSWAGRYRNPASEDVFGWTTTPETVSDALRGADAFKADSKTTARAGDYLGQIDDVLRHGADDPVFEGGQWGPPSRVTSHVPPPAVADAPQPWLPPDGYDVNRFNDLFKQFGDTASQRHDSAQDARLLAELDDSAIGYFGPIMREYGGYNGKIFPQVEDLGTSADIRADFVKLLDKWQADGTMPSTLIQSMQFNLVKFDELANGKLGDIMDETMMVEDLKTLARTEGGGYLDHLEDLRKALKDEPEGSPRRLALERAIKSSDEAGTNELTSVTFTLGRTYSDVLYEGDVSAEYARGRLLELRNECAEAGDTHNVAYIQRRIDAMDKDIIKITGADERRRVERLKTLAKTEGGGYLDDLEDLRKALKDEPPGTIRRLEWESAVSYADELAQYELDDAVSALRQTYSDVFYEGDVSAEYARGRLLELRDDCLKVGDTENAAYVQSRIDAMDKDIIKFIG